LGKIAISELILLKFVMVVLNGPQFEKKISNESGLLDGLFG